MTRVGYARVSTREQNPEAQEAELCAAGATRVFVDRGESSRVKDRPQWIACLDYLRSGDTLVVRRLDRIAGSEKMAIETINDLAERGVNIRSLTEPDIDTTTPMGRALFGIVAVFAQLRVATFLSVCTVLRVTGTVSPQKRKSMANGFGVHAMSKKDTGEPVNGDSDVPMSKAERMRCAASSDPDDRARYRADVMRAARKIIGSTPTG